ncbi:MAG: hypothetical protein GWO24_01490 [Akkermansiaceae bacterium]|nr:hypothetical protein [Akkermansiaceae bacterium]
MDIGLRDTILFIAVVIGVLPRLAVDRPRLPFRLTDPLNASDRYFMRAGVTEAP